MREFLAVVSALSDPNRLRLLLSLQGREQCVCNLVDFIGLADSTVSKHMSILRQAGLVDSRKQGRWVYYRLADGDASPFARQMLELTGEHLRGDKIISSDGIRMAEIVRQNADTKCQHESVSCNHDTPIHDTPINALETA
jgi:ArsR family transcriptional regulator